MFFRVDTVGNCGFVGEVSLVLVEYLLLLLRW